MVIVVLWFLAMKKTIGSLKDPPDPNQDPNLENLPLEQHNLSKRDRALAHQQNEQKPGVDATESNWP